MRLLEYEAKQLLAAHGAQIPAGQLFTQDLNEPILSLPFVMKVQIPIGGRGKAGGVRPVYTDSEFRETAKELLSNPLLGYRVNTLLAEEMLEIKQELYLAITVDRPSRSLVILAHTEGGIDIEEAVRQSAPHKIPLQNEPDESTTQQLLEYTGLTENMRGPVDHLLHALWATCVQEDALLVEINPLIVTATDQLYCADAKIELDDNAAFRHNWNFEQNPTGSQFVILNEQGTVGSMANGAGLAMATVDAIQQAGAQAANFLDVGGGTNARGMADAFERLSQLPRIKAIVINIFGGITRCDEVAEAILMAQSSVTNLPQLYIRLTGTNEAKGKEILERAGIATLPDLQSCVTAATQGTM